MQRFFFAVVVGAALSACGGAAASPTVPVGTSAPPQVTNAPGVSPGGLPEADVLCALLGAEDWAQFGYVTAAQPDVSTDGPGSAYCAYANGLGLDAFIDVSVEDAEETYQTVIENAGFDGSPVELPGADEATIDTELSADSAGIVVRRGRVTFTIALPSGDAAEAQLMALAAIVLQRAAAFA